MQGHLAIAGLVLSLLVFGLLKLYSLNFVRGDEHLYNYMSLLVLDGYWPYRDFIFVHPPLQIYLAALVFQMTDYSLAVAKFLPSIAAMISGVHIFLIGRHLLGKLEALLATLLFLFTFDVLRGSSHLTAANIALAFLLAGTYQVIMRRSLVGGILLGCGALTALYVVPMALMLIVLTALRSRRESLRLLLSFGTLFGSAVALFWMVGSDNFLYCVATFHFSKDPMPYPWFSKFRHVFFLNTPLMVGFLPAIAWAVARQGQSFQLQDDSATSHRSSERWRELWTWVDPWQQNRIGAAILFATFAFGYVLFYSTITQYYSYYFMLIMPWMALMTAYVGVDVVRFTWRHLRGPDSEQAKTAESAHRKKHRASKRKERRRTSTPQRPPVYRLWPLLAPLAVLIIVYEYRDGIGAERVASFRNTVSRYTWSDSPYLGATANSLVRTLFWSGERDRRDPPFGITRYLQHETVHTPTIDQFTERLREECQPGERIFGDYSLGPFAASVSDCVLAANLVDSNTHHIEAGGSTWAEWVRMVEADRPGLAIVRRESHMLKPEVMRRYFYRTFPRVVFTWNDDYMGRVELRRRAETPEADPSG
jgi:hypothetical protein